MSPRRLALLFTVLPAVLSASPTFAPDQVPAHEYTGGWEHFVGGGVAVFDCNDDYFPEAFVAGGSTPALLLQNTTGKAGDPISMTPLDSTSLTLTGVIGAYPLDIDSDGLMDLSILRSGENLLMRGLGDCRFEPLPDSLGFHSTDAWTTAFTATWEHANRLPTLAFGNYVDRNDPKGPFETCDRNQLFRPLSDHYVNPVPLTPGYCPLSMLFSDWSRTGRQDLRISNDRHYYVKEGSEQLWAMEQDPRLFSTEDGWREYKIWGMGIASRDLNGNGQQEIYLTSMGDQKLQSRALGESGPRYDDVTYDLGTTAHRPYLGDDGRPSTGWHVAFGDVQNDGRDDIFVSKGNVEQMPSAAMADPNNLLLQNQDGHFSEFGDVAGIATKDRSRGAALVDFNLDGKLDLMVVNRRAPLEMYENTTSTTGHWVLLSITQPAPNTRAIGAFVEVRTTERVHLRELTVGGGHAGGDAAPLHIGLGKALSADLRVIWPDGNVTDWTPLPMNQHTSVHGSSAHPTLKRLNP
ncbi:MAG: CRTAC1 family protein [Pseudoruegeria sp.]